ncbi:hypothetical protein EVAR_32435_1 [Eumeta japonica]|uniref:Uncharacterized protein n=1 Tax=Eumeta variegata TaxID=151549 RepID=A0A4C1VLJ2_EUMVA|nr:hypothetical protein EVAR_32435_1 [Eumeta japonica]
MVLEILYSIIQGNGVGKKSSPSASPWTRTATVDKAAPPQQKDDRSINPERRVRRATFAAASSLCSTSWMFHSSRITYRIFDMMWLRLAASDTQTSGKLIELPLPHPLI